MNTNVRAQTFDEKVAEDFMFFLASFKENFDALKSDREKEICQKWLDKLTIEAYTGTYEKQMRNIYLSRLVLSMSSRQPTAPFNMPPRSVPLSLDGVFNEITAKPIAEMEKEKKMNNTKKKWMKLVRNRELEIADLNHLSNDGRTYVAFKTLPEDSGVFAYIAVAMGGDTDCQWVNVCGQPMPTPVVTPLDLKVESPNAERTRTCHREDKAYQIKARIRSILSDRKSPETRRSMYEFFKTVYSSIEQEMLREEDPNSTACHDPYVQRLLVTLLNDRKTPCHQTYDPNMYKRIKMLSTLKKRVNIILRKIERRNVNLSEIDDSSVCPMLSLIKPATNCPSPISEKLWQGALMEQPTCKMTDALAKSYPGCLVKMLLALLTRERRKIIDRLQERHDKLVLSMKNDLKDEVKRGLTSYKAARKEWVDAMRVVLRYNELKGALAEKKIGGHSSNDKSEYLREMIRKEIGDSKKRLDKMNRKNERLQDDICDLNRDHHWLTDKMEFERAQNADQLRELENDINAENGMILDRTQTIEQLAKMLNELER